MTSTVKRYAAIKGLARFWQNHDATDLEHDLEGVHEAVCETTQREIAGMPGALSLSLLLAGTILLMAVSWRSLLQPGSHGFFRFFAFEAILGIIVINAPAWFRRPFARLQLLSWALLLVALALAVHGFSLLRRLGQSTRPAPGSPIFRVENTSSLVTSGAYRFIRHPLYASLLYLAWGAALKSLTLASVILAVVATATLVATAKAEESENVRRFGDAYREYMAHTRWLFIPFVL